MKLKLWRSLLLGLCLSNAIAHQVQAQIIPDGTTNTTVNPTNSVINIEGGDRAGDNLFHSFEEFSVPNGSEAFFNNSNDIVNIFSRVTGGDISNIDGLIRANGDASLFLINPAGIIFGEGAALDLGGSFTASTAESIVFTNNVEFSTTDATEPPLLTINQPLGLNFGNNPGDIAVNGSNLEVNNSETLALFGGNVTITGGQIIAPGANIELGGLTAAGQISFTQSEDTFNSFSFPEGVARGDITLTNGAEVNVQASGGGNIKVNARNLELSGGESGESSIIAGIGSESLEAQAGEIVLDLTGDIIVDRKSSIFNSVEESAVGNAGGINITTNNLFLNGGQIFTSTFGQGNTGKITIDANGTIEAAGESSQGFPSGIFSRVEESAVGNAGGINITTTNLSLTQSGTVDSSTAGQGNTGKITIDANGTIEAVGESSQGFPSGIFSRVEESAVGNAGGINITTTNLSLTQGGTVDSSTAGQGNTGKITIDANGTIEAVGESSQGFSSGIFNIVEESAVGNAGGIDITTTNLSLIRGGQISASTFSQGDAGKITIDANGTIEAVGETSEGFLSGIFSRIESEARGDSGGIDITTTDLSLTRGSVVEASTNGQGDAGKIALVANGTIEADGESSQGFASGIFSIVEDTGRGNAADVSINTLNLSLTNGAEISVESLGQGNAGNLSIKANSLSLKRASLFASTPVGTGGNINLQIAENLTLRNNSTISAQALQEANGGNIDLNADFVIAQPNQNNDIIAAADRGTGGNINITTNAIFGLESRSSIPENNTNDLDASSELGVDGTIQINELEVNPIEVLEELPVEVIDVTELVSQNLCQQGGSEFVVTGKGGTAPSPTQARDGSVSEVDLVKPVPFSEVEAATQAPAPEGSSEIVEAQGWVVNDRGMVELVASKTDVDSSTAQPNIQVCHQQ